MQTGLLVHVGEVRVGPSFEQQRNDGKRAFGAGLGQRRLREEAEEKEREREEEGENEGTKENRKTLPLHLPFPRGWAG
jgi:hypothetical protein